MSLAPVFYIKCDGCGMTSPDAYPKPSSTRDACRHRWGWTVEIPGNMGKGKLDLCADCSKPGRPKCSRCEFPLNRNFRCARCGHQHKTGD